MTRDIADGQDERVCGYCRDTGVVVASLRESNAIQDTLVFCVNPCPDCLASESVPEGVFGIWSDLDLLPEHVNNYLETLDER